MKKYCFILVLLLVVGILACKTVKPIIVVTPPMPTIQKRGMTVLIDNYTNGQIVCYTNGNKIKCFTYEKPIPRTLVSFGWTYSGITDNVVFLVYYTTNISGTNWIYLGKVTNDWFTVSITNKQDWYKVRAYNTASTVDIGLFN
jgi:hypothetical protein